jgi:hypothetical protein
VRGNLLGGCLTVKTSGGFSQAMMGLVLECFS